MHVLISTKFVKYIDDYLHLKNLFLLKLEILFKLKKKIKNFILNKSIFLDTRTLEKLE